MGQSGSKDNNFNFKPSNCKKEIINDYTKRNKSIDLCRIVENYDVHPVLQVFYYKVKHLGYDIPSIDLHIPCIRLEQIIQKISEIGIPLTEGYLTDINVLATCYESNLSIIYKCIDNGSILIGGIMDKGIVLVIGYDQESVILKIKDSYFSLKNEEVHCIKELWDIQIN